MYLIRLKASQISVDGKGYTSSNESYHVPQLHSKWCNIHSFKYCNCETKQSPAPPVIISLSDYLKTESAAATATASNDQRQLENPKVNHLNLVLEKGYSVDHKLNQVKILKPKNQEAKDKRNRPEFPSSNWNKRRIIAHPN